MTNLPEEAYLSGASLAFLCVYFDASDLALPTGRVSANLSHNFWQVRRFNSNVRRLAAYSEAKHRGIANDTNPFSYLQKLSRQVKHSA